MTTATPDTSVKLPSLIEIDDDGTLHVNFHEGQSRTWESKARFTAMFAGSQGGKTSFGPWWLNREISKVYQAMVDAGMSATLRTLGMGDFLAATATFDLFKLSMLPALRYLFEDILHIGYYWAGDKIMELSENLEPYGKFWAADKGSKDARMFGRIILRSADSEGGLESSTAKAAWLDEVGQPKFTLAAWRAVRRRLSISRGPVLFTTTLYNMGWLKSEIYDRWVKGHPAFNVIQFDSTANPGFSVAEFEEARRSMPTHEFDMFYRGRFAKPEGMVYKSFDQAQCVIEPFTIPTSWPLYVGHDFGSNNPAYLIYAYDPATGIFYLINEGKPSGITIQGQVLRLKRLTNGYQVRSRRGGSHQEVSSRNDYTHYGWPIAEPTINSVSVGIQRVFDLHARNAIMVFSNCEGYLKEKLSYAYKPDATGTTSDDIENKSRFHYMDAERGILSGFHDRVGSNKATQRKTNSFGGVAPPPGQRARRLFGQRRAQR